MKRTRSLASLAATFMHNDCYQFMATVVVGPGCDRCQSSAYAVVLSYITWSVAGPRWQLSYVTVAAASHLPGETLGQDGSYAGIKLHFNHKKLLRRKCIKRAMKC